MFSLISGPVRANTLRVCFCLALTGLIATSYPAKSEEDFFAPGLEVATIQSAISNTAAQHSYRVSAIISLGRSEDAALSDTRFGNSLWPQCITEPKQKTLWPIEEHWKIAPLNERVSLSTLLLYESNGDRISIKPRRHSIRFEWRKSFP
jgi:hypothetical protein